MLPWPRSQSAGAAAKTLTRIGDNALRAVAVGALVGMAALMLHGLVDITVWGTRASFFPWLIAGLIVALFRIAMKEKKTKRYYSPSRRFGRVSDGKEL